MVGSDRGSLVLTTAMVAVMNTVAKLPGGTITVSGPIKALPKGAFSIAVVGGTGIFAGAHGMLTILAPTNPEDGGQHLPPLVRADRLSLRRAAGDRRPQRRRDEHSCEYQSSERRERRQVSLRLDEAAPGDRAGSEIVADRRDELRRAAAPRTPASSRWRRSATVTVLTER